MKVAFLLFNVDGAGGTERSVVTQANALSAQGVEVEILSLVRQAATPHYPVDPAVRVTGLVDRREPGEPRTVRGLVDDGLAARLDALASMLVPARWDSQFTGLTDAACEHHLPHIEADVLVTVTPGLLAIAAQLMPQRTALVHQEHRSSAQRTVGMEPLLTFTPRADVVALLTPSVRDWFLEEIGALAPHTIVMPNPLPNGYKPRSTLDTQLIVAAGRLAFEKQFSRLVEAFGAIADEIPQWRLRILGDGPQRLELMRITRKLGLYDRVELPGQSADMPSEWAMASISALASRSEGLPLVVQEAMAAGVPVAAFDAPSGARALIKHDVDGLLVSPQSTPGLASALLRLATDDDLRHRLGDAALQSSREYDADVLARRWIGVFEDAVTRRAARTGRVLQRLTQIARTPPEPARPVEAETTVTPAQARTTALGWAVACAARATDRWFVIPSNESGAATVVVPMDDRLAYLTELGSDGSPELLSLVDTAGYGWPERRGTLAELSRAMTGDRTERISLEPWPLRNGVPGLLSIGCRVDVEFWETGPDGGLVAPGPNGYTSKVLPGSTTVETELEGVRVRTLPLMAQPTVLDCTFPVDVVLTWVDGNDPVWNAAREARLAGLPESARRKEASGVARFVSRDELRYSMRSVFLFAPWVRTIHLVTSGQVPPWLVEHPRVRLVDHRDILPPDALPTFNSHAIESCLHKVPDLSEHFVYLNDDFLLARPLTPRSFFTAAGQPRVFFSGLSLGTEESPEAAPWLHAAWNNRRLLRHAFGAVTTHSLAHAPYAHRRSTLEEIEKRFPDELARTARSPFRSADDVSLLSSLAQHYGLLTGSAVVGSAETLYIDISSSDVARRLRRAQWREQDFVCLGDHHEHALKPSVLDELLQEFYDTYLPVPAPWESGSAAPVG